MATESPVGIFWGPAGRLPSAGSSPSTVQLPRLVQSPSSTSSSRDSAANSLLEVLHTLLRSIKSDMDNFMKTMRAMDQPTDNTVHFVGQNGPRYYSPAIAAEDCEFFVREREMEADKEAALAASALARERHCALVDKQVYNCDRRKRTPGSKYLNLWFGPKIISIDSFSCLRRNTSSSNRRHIENAAAAAEIARIDRHRRKIEHLLNVLQQEIAKETRREIEFLEFSGPSGQRSRQSRRHMALIIKARYEAADRIMRILEEYKIVIGVSAADYLLKTVAEGKALMG
ncbi:hypothetical protein V7S43_016133 [Phytophthora oleae]|uniref:Uncharacterized protein n=1 Tax=Phytophthora oleae TaxID=2107226 RepID=A0ABD3F006_9STRA